MIKVDLSRAVPWRLGMYLLGVIPGVLFESSVVIGNPQSAAFVVSRLREFYPFGPYALLVIFLVSSLFIGQAFFLLAWVVDLLIALAFKLGRYAIRRTFGSQWLYDRFTKLQGLAPNRNIFVRQLGRVVFWARGYEFSIESRPVLRCLHLVTRQVLEKRYGIDLAPLLRHSDGSEWTVWYSALGKPGKGFKEASLASRVFIACGLAGITALTAAPALRGWYFIGLCFVFTFAGFYVAVDLARWRMSPVRRTMGRLQSMLLELSEVNTATEKRKSDSAEGLIATVDANNE